MSDRVTAAPNPGQTMNDVVSTDTMFEWILEYLDHVSLSVAMTPCRSFLRRCRERRLWRRLLEKRWPGVLTALQRPLSHERDVYIGLSVPLTPRAPVDVAAIVVVLELFVDGELCFCTSHTLLEPRQDDDGDPSNAAVGFIPITCVPRTREYFFPNQAAMHGYEIPLLIKQTLADAQTHGHIPPHIVAWKKRDSVPSPLAMQPSQPSVQPSQPAVTRDCTRRW